MGVDRHTSENGAGFAAMLNECSSEQADPDYVVHRERICENIDETLSLMSDDPILKADVYLTLYAYRMASEMGYQGDVEEYKRTVLRITSFLAKPCSKDILKEAEL